MNKTLEKILEDELFENQTFEGEGSLSIKHTSAGTKMPITLNGNTIQDGEPSPENPVELRHLADDINMFDEQWTNSSTTSTSTNFIPVFKDEYCIYSQDNEGSAVNYHFYETKESTVQSIYADANTGFTPPSNGFIKLSKRLIPEGTKCKLQKGSVITPYSAFGKGTIEIKNHNKNYLNVPKSFTFTQAKEIPVSIPAGNYKVTFNSENHSGNDYPVIKFSDNNKAGNLDIKEHTFSINKNETKVVFYSNGYNWPGSAGIEATIENLMISKDGGDYEEYQGQDVVIQSKPLRSLPNGVYDEKDGNKTIRRVGEVILDGTEQWEYFKVSNTRNQFYTSLKNHLNSQTEVTTMSTHFIGDILPNRSKNFNIVYTSTNGICFCIDNMTTIEEWKAFLVAEKEKGTPVTVYYELAEPIIEEDNENKLANLTAYDGQTNIACTSEIPCGLKVDAKISKIKKLEEQINAQGGV